MVSLLLPVIYLAFISLGLPDSLLGSAWPVMYPELGTSVSSAGIISMIIAAGTIVSSLNSDRLNTRFGTGKITAVSVLTTAVALFGFSVSHSFLALCLWGIPYGLGVGRRMQYGAGRHGICHQSFHLEQRLPYHRPVPDCADSDFIFQSSALAEAIC